MTTYSILVTNNAPGCNNDIEQQIQVTGCTTYIVRLASNSNALGPFNVYVDSSLYYSALTRTDMFNGVVVTLDCVTSTPTMTPTQTMTQTPTSTFGTTPPPTPAVTETPTKTPTQTPTPTETITQTPSTTPGATPDGTPTQTPTQTPTPTETITQTPTQTMTQTQSGTPNVTPSETPTQTPTETITQTPTQTITQTPTNSETPTQTPTQTPSVTPDATPEGTPTQTPTQTQTPTETITQTPTQTPTDTPSVTPTQTTTQTPTNSETPTQTPTQTITQTQSGTPNVTPTETMTPTPTQTITQTMTQTPTQTPSPTAPGLLAFMLIDQNSAAPRANLSAWMVSRGSTWRGFNQTPQAPSTVQATFNVQMNAYMSYTGWGVYNPSVITAPISTTTTGTNDAYNQPINAYKFQTVQLPVGTMSATSWVTWFVSTAATNGQQYSTIYNGSDAAGLPRTMTANYSNLTVNYTGSTNMPAGVYRVYTTYSDSTFNPAVANLPQYYRGGDLI